MSSGCPPRMLWGKQSSRSHLLAWVCRACETSYIEREREIECCLCPVKGTCFDIQPQAEQSHDSLSAARCRIYSRSNTKKVDLLEAIPHMLKGPSHHSLGAIEVLNSFKASFSHLELLRLLAWLVCKLDIQHPQMHVQGHHPHIAAATAMPSYHIVNRVSAPAHFQPFEDKLNE